MRPDSSEQATPLSGFDGAVEAFRHALDSFVKGDPKPCADFFSRRDDVTLANPLGPRESDPRTSTRRSLTQQRRVRCGRARRRRSRRRHAP